jgi:hypothetical protein
MLTQIDRVVMFVGAVPKGVLSPGNNPPQEKFNATLDTRPGEINIGVDNHILTGFNAGRFFFVNNGVGKTVS